MLPTAGWGSGALLVRARVGSRCTRRWYAGLGAYEVSRPVPVLVRDYEGRLILELKHRFISFGIQLGLVLVVFDLLRRARQAGAQEVAPGR